MKHQELTEELREHIVLHAFQMLDEDLAADLMQHLEVCAVCRQEFHDVQSMVDSLGYSVSAALPPPGLKARLLARIEQEALDPTPQAFKRTVRAFISIVWQPSQFPGVSFHWLRQDVSTGTAAALIKVQPGYSYGSHRHRGGEDCLVLQGSFRDQWGEYHAGDFLYCAPGSTHHNLQALEGEDCILFVVAHGGVEFLSAELPP